MTDMRARPPTPPCIQRDRVTAPGPRLVLDHGAAIENVKRTKPNCELHTYSYAIYYYALDPDIHAGNANADSALLNFHVCMLSVPICSYTVTFRTSPSRRVALNISVSTQTRCAHNAHQKIRSSYRTLTSACDVLERRPLDCCVH